MFDWSEWLREAIKARVRERIAKEAPKRLDRIRERTGKLPTDLLVELLREEKERR